MDSHKFKILSKTPLKKVDIFKTFSNEDGMFNIYDMYVLANESGRYSVRCYCWPARRKQLCKHVLAIANFDFSYLIDSSDEAMIRQVLEPTTMQADLSAKLDVRKDLEKQIARLQREKKKDTAVISDMLGVAGGY